MIGRRGIVAGAGAIGFTWLVRRASRGEEELDFEPVPGAPGWSFAKAGSVSGIDGQAFLTLGLDASPDPLPPEQLDKVLHHAQGAGVPVAVFSDYFCPYCRLLTSRLMNRVPPLSLSITWHELPLLGPNSELASRAALAAGLQNGYSEFYLALNAKGFRPLPRWFGQVATGIGLDGDQLVRDMDSAEVARLMSLSARAAARLGFFATPGIVIGRYAVLGALDDAPMERLIAQVAEDG